MLFGTALYLIRFCNKLPLSGSGKWSTVRKAIFLDRDGVINKSFVVDGKPYAPTRLVDFEILPDVQESLFRLKDAGYIIIIITNQPDLSTGKQTPESLEEIHNYLSAQCPIDLIKICSHTSEDHCYCRKPNPGMIFEAAKELSIDLAQSFMIGDRWKDVEAGQRAGCKETFFIDYGYKEKKPEGTFSMVKSLKECTMRILGDWCLPNTEKAK